MRKNNKVETSNMESKLWNVANELRGRMDANEFKSYMLSILFYRFISESFVNEANEVLQYDNLTIKQAETELGNEFIKEMVNKVGFYIKSEHLFSNIIEKINNGKQDEVIDLLQAGFNDIQESIKNNDSEADFDDLFSECDLTSTKLGDSVAQRNKLISNIMLQINDITRDSQRDQMGDAFEYCLKLFASEAGKKGGEFYTPSEVSTLVAKLVGSQVHDAETIYDPTCGSGSLLIKAYQNCGKKNFTKLYGQELNRTTYNLARQNMLMHSITYKAFDIMLGDTIENDKFMNQKFDIIVANPPFGTKWSHEGLEDDPRFTMFSKLPPKSKGEYAFIIHMFEHLANNGVLATVAPLGVLFRGASEGVIREEFIMRYNALDAVITLPENLFYGTGIPACILVFKKDRDNDNIMFIDASREFEKVKTQNKLTEENINKIVDAYQHKKEIDKYSRLVNIKEIKENDFNLNMPRYIDTFEEEEPIDIDEVLKELKDIKQQIKEKEEKLKELFKEIKDSDE